MSRARGKLRTNHDDPVTDARTARLVRAFADALNARDTDRILDLMSETVKIDVCNVGGGRGPRGVWTERTLAGTRFEYAEHDGAPVVLLFGASDRVLSGVVRAETADGVIGRVIDYHYAPDTVRHVAEGLGLAWHDRGHHQPRRVLVDMVATTGLPWHATADD